MAILVHGGWAAIIVRNGKEIIVNGSAESTTNQRMELMAIISGLEMVNESEEVIIYSDSQYRS